MRKIILFQYFIWLCLFAQGQIFTCGWDGDNLNSLSSPKSTVDCNRKEPIDTSDFNLLLHHFIPNDTTPIVTIKLNMNIWRKDDGTGNYWKDLPEYRDTLRQVFDWINYVFSHNIVYSLPIVGAPFIPDTKIRIELDTVYYYNNTEIAYIADNQRYIFYLLEHYPERLSNFNYHFVLNQTALESGASNGYNAMYPSAYSVREADTNVKNNMQIRMYALAKHMVHEICHNFGLNHTYNHDNINISHPDFLWDVFGRETQSWCENPEGYVCYHAGGWNCDPYDSSNTCTNNMMGGTQSSRHFSALQCAKLHRAVAISTLKKCAYGYHSIPKEISANQTWDYSRKLYQDIIIKSGATLTLLCTLEMVSNAQIIIQPGGKLIVDGGTLTNACPDQLWEGIRVMGNKNQRQLPQYQGVVELKNGAVIENARNAIVTCPDWDHPDFYDHSGGIIRATDATFRNNLRSVAFYEYSNTNASGNIIDNVSYFKNCTFTLDNDNILELNAGADFSNHVTLWRVRGVKFSGCTFENLTSNPSGKAIYTENAGFKLEQYCLPGSSLILPCDICTPYTCNTFSGFNKAIDVQTTGVQHSVIVDHSYFEKNKTNSITIAGNNYAQIIRSDFNLSNGPNQGAYLSNSSDYLIEENHFYVDDNTAIDNPQRVLRSGIEINKSGTSNNLVYRNNFTRIANGITTSGTNASQRSSTGLEFQCNTFTDNKTDLYIYSGIIKNFQGSLSKGADNHFIRSKSYSINNEGSDYVSYYYSQGSDHEPIILSQWVNKFNNAAANSCQSTLCTGSPQNQSPQELLSDYEELQSTSNQLQITFQTDGHSQIMENYYNEEISWDEIPEATIEMWNAILVIGNEMRDISHSAVQSILNDSIFDVELLKEWYSIIQTPVAKYSLAETHAMLKEFDQSDQVLQEIPDRFDFDDEQMLEHDNYMVFHEFKKELHTSEKTWYDLTEEQIVTMQNIAEATNGRSATMAKGVLCFFFNICPPDEVLEEAGERKPEKGTLHATSHVEARFIASQEEITPNEISLFPNPTNGNLHIESSITKINHIEIYDIMGKLVLSKEIHALSKIININSLPNSIYLMRIYLDNGEIVIRKVVKS